MGSGTSSQGGSDPEENPPADTRKESERLQQSLKARVSGAIKQGIWSDFYTREQDLGSGMSGVVFLVSSKADPSQKFACKSIEKAGMSSDEVSSLQKEIELCASLDHPNIVKIVESYESSRDITMIMELCQGGELYDSLIGEGEYTQRRAAELFLMMVQAVNYCHQVGVVHRDLKLENFVFESKPTTMSVLKLIDFGLSVKHSGSGIKKMYSIVGTAYYMAPEVLDVDAEYDSKCDVWALGVILFMMLTGCPPFNGATEKGIMRRAAAGVVDWAPWHHGPDFDAARQLISAMLVPAEQRLTCEQVLQHPWLTERASHKGGAIHTEVAGALQKFSKKGKLYKSAAQIVALKLSPSELQDLRQQFQVMDADSSGTISLHEFKKGLAACKIEVDDFAAFFNSIDLDGTGLISYSEFLSATLSSTNKMTTDRLNDAFDALDPDHSGFIDTSELQGVLSDFADDMEISDILAQADKNQDNQISREEFLTLCMHHAHSHKVKSEMEHHLSSGGKEKHEGNIDKV